MNVPEHVVFGFLLEHDFPEILGASVSSFSVIIENSMGRAMGDKYIQIVGYHIPYGFFVFLPVLKGIPCE